MAYTPWLNVNFPKNITYSAFKDAIKIGNSPVNLANLTNEPQADISNVLVNDLEKVQVNSILTESSDKEFSSLIETYESDKQGKTFKPLMKFLFSTLKNIHSLGDNLVENPKLKNSIKQNFVGYYRELIGFDKEIAGIATIQDYSESNHEAIFGVTDASSISTSTIINDAGSTLEKKLDKFLSKIKPIFEKINKTWTKDIIGTAQRMVDQVQISIFMRAYSDIISDIGKINKDSGELTEDYSTLREKFIDFEANYQADKIINKFYPIVGFLYEIAVKIGEFTGTQQNLSLANTELKGEIGKHIESTLRKYYEELIRHENKLKELLGAGYTTQYSGKNIFSISSTETSDVTSIAVALDRIRELFDKINRSWLDNIVGTAHELEKKKHEGLLDSFPLYKTIITGIQNTSSSVPPSGAVAGIYAYVDRTRGVWKAPANVSISGIVGPTATFTASQLDALNVHVDSGKSINAIRPFTGKGTLVFGARTLAGNDNEWRYINVRRFFNFAEESIKKATEQFVFEPNDANTWVRIQAMIENFLTTQWRQGALQGVKPEHAFYVAVGLGKTMTAQDILEGKMIIEIGMAVVRPAEFIVLRFSHKMAES
ncbi:MAG: phage tail sheath family protein [Candidatus Electrothrix sp. AW2]|nr:phage tail sheath family protein [Candidatus Electrothrix gigas]